MTYLILAFAVVCFATSMFIQYRSKRGPLSSRDGELFYQIYTDCLSSLNLPVKPRMSLDTIGSLSAKTMEVMLRGCSAKDMELAHAVNDLALQVAFKFDAIGSSVGKYTWAGLAYVIVKNNPNAPDYVKVLAAGPDNNKFWPTHLCVKNLMKSAGKLDSERFNTALELRFSDPLSSMDDCYELAGSV